MLGTPGTKTSAYQALTTALVYSKSVIPYTIFPSFPYAGKDGGGEVIYIMSSYKTALRCSDRLSSLLV